EVLVELDVHGAHLALAIVDLVDAFLLLLDPLGVLAAEIGEIGHGHRVVVILARATAEGEHEGDGESFHHDPPSSVCLLADTKRPIISDTDEDQYDDDLELQFNGKSCSLTNEA